VRKRTWILISGFSTLTLGLLYRLDALGPEKMEVQLWAWTAIALGLLLLGERLALPHLSPTLAGIFMNLTAAGAAMLQPLPTYLWIAFHGRTLPDAMGHYVAHWAYALPHLLVFGSALTILFTPMKDVTDQETQERKTSSNRQEKE
jgi:hypothetical protein